MREIGKIREGSEKWDGNGGDQSGDAGNAGGNVKNAGNQGDHAGNPDGNLRKAVQTT